MDQEIREYVSKCEVCKACKPTNQIQRSPMGKFRETNRPFEMISIDFIGPLPRSRAGFVFILVVVDLFSKFVHLHPMRSASTQSTVKCLNDHIFLLFGTPRYVISDNGPQFTSIIYKKFLVAHGVTSWYTSRYHPQANATEAANKTAEGAIRSYLKDAINHKDWDVHIAEIACAMNTSKHTSTGMSPYFVLFGKHMLTSGNDYGINSQQIEGELRSDESEANRRKKIWILVKENLHKSYEQNKRRYDLRSREIQYATGDEVWVKNRVLSNASKAIISKFSPQYRKCIIKRKVGSNSYEITEMDGKMIGIYNTDCFKK